MRAGLLAFPLRQACQAYPVQNGGLKNNMLGPSMVRGCPQQKALINPKARGGSTSGKASAAQPDSGPLRDRKPATAPNTIIPDKKRTSPCGPTTSSPENRICY